MGLGRRFKYFGVGAELGIPNVFGGSWADAVLVLCFRELRAGMRLRELGELECKMDVGGV